MLIHSSRRLPVAVAVLLAQFAVDGAEAGAAQPAGALATVPFRALGADGQPVTDLKAADVTLKIDGRPRDIKSFELVDLRTPAPTAEAPAKAGIDPPFASNASAESKGRDVFVVVDEESISPGKEGVVKEALAQLTAALTPADRVALLSVRQGGANVGLTTERARVKSAVDTLAGYGATGEETDIACRTLRVLQTLQSVFASAGGRAPPTVVFFSTAVAALQAGRTTSVGVSSSQLCEIRVEQMNQLGAAAQASRASFFVVELTDSGSSARPAEAAGGLENLAGVTSGENVRLSANVEPQMKRIAASTSAYYLVGFDPDGSDRGGNKRVEVTVARAGVSILAPREVAMGKAAGKTGSANPRDMIRTADAFTALPLRAAAYSSRNPGDNKIRVLALFEPVEPNGKLGAAMVGMFDEAGKLQAQWTAQGNDLSGRPALAALVVQPGLYRLRVAATDGSGRAGAVDVRMAATLVAAGPIQLGDLVLGKMGPTSPIPVLQFVDEEEAIAIVELYGRPAGPLKMYVEVADAPGQPIQVALTPMATSEPDKFLLTAKIPIASLKPGDYLVRAVVGVDGQPDGQVVRTLRKAKAGS